MSISKIRSAFTRTKFQQHLDAQPPRKLAGKTGFACSCPLAVYLGKQTESHLKVRVLPYAWNVTNHKNPSVKSKALPTWAKEFITKVDKHNTNGSITFGTAARILREL